MSTIFEEIIQKKIPAEVLLENDCVIVIKDIAPKALHHYLIITKKCIPCLQVMQPDDWIYAKAMLSAAQEIAKKLQITDYRLIINNGSTVGQTVFHLHMHWLAGCEMTE